MKVVLWFPETWPKQGKKWTYWRQQGKKYEVMCYIWLLDTVSPATKALSDITKQRRLLWWRKWQWHFVFWGWEMCWNICCSCERYRPPPPHTHTHTQLPPVYNVSQEATLSSLTSRWQTDSGRNDLAGWPQRGHSYIDRHIISTLPYLLPALPSVRNETMVEASEISGHKAE